MKDIVFKDSYLLFNSDIRDFNEFLFTLIDLLSLNIEMILSLFLDIFTYVLSYL